MDASVAAKWFVPAEAVAILSLYLALAVAEDCVVITADSRFHGAVRASPLSDHIDWIEIGQASISANDLHAPSASEIGFDRAR